MRRLLLLISLLVLFVFSFAQETKAQSVYCRFDFDNSHPDGDGEHGCVPSWLPGEIGNTCGDGFIPPSCAEDRDGSGIAGDSREDLTNCCNPLSGTEFEFCGSCAGGNCTSVALSCDLEDEPECGDPGTIGNCGAAGVCDFEDEICRATNGVYSCQQDALACGFPGGSFICNRYENGVCIGHPDTIINNCGDGYIPSYSSCSGLGQAECLGSPQPCIEDILACPSPEPTPPSEPGRTHATCTYDSNGFMISDCNGTGNCNCPGNPYDSDACYRNENCGWTCLCNLPGYSEGDPEGRCFVGGSSCYNLTERDVCVNTDSCCWSDVDDECSPNIFGCNGMLPPTSTPPALCGDRVSIDSAVGCIPVNNSSAFAGSFLFLGIGTGSGMSLLLIGVASFMISTSTGDPRRLRIGKDILIGAIAGLLLMIFATIVLRYIGISILGINTFAN